MKYMNDRIQLQTVTMTKGGTEIDFNVFAGAETGILKGANVNNKACISKNFHNLANLQRDFEITCLREAFKKKRQKKLNFFNSGLPPPPYYPKS